MTKMKTGKTQQEFILVNTTTFIKREWCKTGTSDKDRLTHAEQLGKACWNGLLNEMLHKKRADNFWQAIVSVPY
jgi:hypothetical protein